MKENEVDIMHLIAIDNAFLDCDEDKVGSITKKHFIEMIAENNLKFPADFLFNIISDMQDDSEDISENAIIKYENLKHIIDIYNNCPIFLK